MSYRNGINPNDLSLAPPNHKQGEHCGKCHLVFFTKMALMKHFEDHINAGEVLPVDILNHYVRLQKEAAADASRRIGFAKSVSMPPNPASATHFNGNNMVGPAYAAAATATLPLLKNHQPARARNEIDLNKDYHEENSAAAEDASINLDLTLGH